MGKKTDYDSLKQGFGLVHGLSTEFVRMCERHSVPIEALHRLVTPEGESTMEAIAGRINEDWKRSQRAKGGLLPAEYRVYVGYDMPRDMATLETEFSKGRVSDLFTGNYDWTNHSSCVGIDQSPGERLMLIKNFDREVESETIIAEMDKMGYRPATHLEAYAFAKACPELQQQFWIMALGSFALMSGRHPHVMVLCGVSGERSLANTWFGNKWSSNDRFLFVRNS